MKSPSHVRFHILISVLCLRRGRFAQTVCSLLVATLLLLAGGCRTARTTTAYDLYQYSTLQALIDGVYDGDLTLDELAAYGDFGIGTFNALYGEMILLDGQFYRIDANGDVSRPPRSERTPFACVVFFEESEQWSLPAGMDYAGFQVWLDKQLESVNMPVAIRVDGTFRSVKTRSVPAQERPYPKLTEVTRQQPEFTFEDTSGTLVGFRLPDYLAGVNVAGYHLHYLTANADGGGHLLAFESLEGTVSIARRRRIILELMDTVAFDQAGLSAIGQEDVHAVER